MSVLFLRQGGGTPSSTPSDDDADISVTARTDRDGATVRPGRITILHAVDSVRNASLVGADRTAMDRYAVRSIRAGRLPTQGETNRLRLYFMSSRAGDSFAPRQIVVRYSTSSRRLRLQTDTTNRTDRDATTLRIPEWSLGYSADSARNADLRQSTNSAGTAVTDRDRFRVRLMLPLADAVGYVHRLQFVTDGRAGNAGGPLSLSVRYSLVPARLYRAEAI